jgi:type IV pilus assembly protein PilA
LKKADMIRKSRKAGAGFTLIELMIVVAIVGILAAVAIPSYSDYVTRSRLSEVTHSFDALASAAAEYHAAMGFWTTDSPDQIASLANRRATWIFVDNGVDNVRYQATIQNIASTVDGRTLVMNITYDLTTGYRKSWDTAASSLSGIYIPRE